MKKGVLFAGVAGLFMASYCGLWYAGGQMAKRKFADLVMAVKGQVESAMDSSLPADKREVGKRGVGMLMAMLGYPESELRETIIKNLELGGFPFAWKLFLPMPPLIKTVMDTKECLFFAKTNVLDLFRGDFSIEAKFVMPLKGGKFTGTPIEGSTIKFMFDGTMLSSGVFKRSHGDLSLVTPENKSAFTILGDGTMTSAGKESIVGEGHCVCTVFPEAEIFLKMVDRKILDQVLPLLPASLEFKGEIEGPERCIPDLPCVLKFKDFFTTLRLKGFDDVVIGFNGGIDIGNKSETQLDIEINQIGTFLSLIEKNIPADTFLLVKAGILMATGGNMSNIKLKIEQRKKPDGSGTAFFLNGKPVLDAFGMNDGKANDAPPLVPVIPSAPEGAPAFPDAKPEGSVPAESGAQQEKKPQ